MDLSTTKQAISTVLHAHPEVHFGMLFGSVARGTAGAASDVDIAVAGRRIPILQLTGQLSLALAKQVQVVRVEDASIPLLDQLLRDAIVVYERDRGQAAEWRNRTLALLETDRIWYRRMRDAFLRRTAEKGF